MKIFNSSRHFIPERKYNGTEKISSPYLDNLLPNDYLMDNTKRTEGVFLFVSRPVSQKVRNQSILKGFNFQGGGAT
jgi:hypothetical protein